jgi:predicted metal-dependent peptidase
MRCDNDFKQMHLHRACNNFLDFIEKTITPTQVCNHLRKGMKRYMDVVVEDERFDWSMLM